MTKHILQFNVMSTYQQEIEIVDPDITIDQLVEGLNDGRYLTTMSWDSDTGENGLPTIVPVANLNHTTAVIHSGSADPTGDHSQYTGFDLIESSDDE